MAPASLSRSPSTQRTTRAATTRTSVAQRTTRRLAGGPSRPGTASTPRTGRTLRRRRSTNAATWIVVALIGVALIGVGIAVVMRNRAGSLVGTWRVDTAQIAPKNLNTLDPENRDAAQAMTNVAMGMLMQSRVTFTASTVSFAIGEFKQEGTYRVVSQDGNHLTLVITTPSDSKRWLAVVNGNHLLVTENGSTLAFNRL